MRDKLAKIVHDPIYGSEADDSALHTADAIIAALPDMVVPLVWKGPVSTLDDGCYYTSIRTRSGKTWCVDYVSRGSSERLGYHSSEHTAKAAAQADYTRRIMSALGTDKGEG